MGAAIDAFAESFGIVGRNPLLVAIAFGTFFVGGLLGGVLGVVPLVGPLVNFVVVVPVLLAGTVAVTDAAVTGDVSFDDFTTGVSENWKPLAGAYAILFCVVFAASIVLVVALLVVGVGLLGATSSGDPSTAAFGGLGIVTLGLFFVAMVVTFVGSLVVQFLDVAVVVGDESATGAFREGWRLFATAPLSTIGYGLLRGAIMSVTYVVPFVFLALYLTTGSEPTALLVLAGLSFVVLAPLAMTLGFAYHVAYYRGRRDVGGRSGRESQSTAPNGAAGWR